MIEPLDLNAPLEGGTRRTMGLAPGFDSPVKDSQANFRVILAAMARPGTNMSLPRPLHVSPQFAGAAIGIAFTLLDRDTSYWLPAMNLDVQLERYIAFHTGAVRTQNVKEADFLLCPDVQSMPDLFAAKCGNPEYPDRSATFVIEAGPFDEGWPVELEGPGIETNARFSALGLSEAFWRGAQTNHERFPLGVDFLFTSGDQVSALPRSTAIRF